MFLIKDKVLEKNEWYQNPMTQAFNKGLNEAESEEEMVELYFSALLEAKGLHSDHEKEKFLRAEQNEFLDPFLFKDMELACEIIGQAIEADEKILIYGDYDCDGLTATAILVRVLRDLGADVSYFVPDRLQDGYSLTDKTVDHVLLKKTDLLITVDCGINDDQEILKLMQAGIKVIVSDHHQADQDINNPALAIINPKLQTDNYPFEDLAGAGVAFKLAQALTSYLNLNSYDLSFALCLAAVGTVADSMPLKNENRTMVALATSVFLEKAPLGLQMLTEKYNNSSQLSASFFGFTIGPRLNAAGRMGNLEPALRLLLSDDRSEISEALEELENLNNERKELEQEIYLQAIEQIENMTEEEKKNIILVADLDWHSGVVGIVSARLVQLYSLPVITFAGCHGVLKGSARSIADFNILAAISSAADYTESFGGHLQAAGVNVTADNFPKFKQQVINYAQANPLKKSKLKDFQFQFELAHEITNDLLAKKLTYLEPYGYKNEKPSFVLRDLIIDQWRAVGQGKHISLTLRLSDERLISAIAFNAHGFSRLFRQGDQVDLLVKLNWQEWNDNYSLQLKVLDWQMPVTNKLIWDNPQKIEDTYQINNQEIKSLIQMYGIAKKQFTINNEQIKAVAQYFEEYRQDIESSFNLSLLARAIVREMKVFINPFILQRIMDMFSEIKLIRYEQIDRNNFTLDFLKENNQERNLRETATWKTMQIQELMLDE